MINKQADNKSRDPNFLVKMLHPFSGAMEAEDGELSPSDQMADIGAKVAGGVLLAALWQGYRRTQGSKEPATSLDDTARRQLEKERESGFVSIPGYETPVAYHDIMGRYGLDKKSEDGIVDRVKDFSSDAADWIGSAVPDKLKEDGYISPLFTKDSPIPGIWEAATTKPSWHFPVATTALVASAILANRHLSKKVDKHKMEQKEEHINQVRRQIGELINKELQHTRGMRKSASDESGGFIDAVKKFPVLFGTIQTSLLLTGAYMGYQRGRQDNPEKEVRKMLKDRIRQERANTRPPEVVLPKEYYATGGDTMGEEAGTQQHVKIPELTL